MKGVQRLPEKLTRKIRKTALWVQPEPAVVKGVERRLRESRGLGTPPVSHSLVIWGECGDATARDGARVRPGNRRRE